MGARERGRAAHLRPPDSRNRDRTVPRRNAPLRMPARARAVSGMSALPAPGALTAAAERVTFDSLLWISACLAPTQHPLGYCRYRRRPAVPAVPHLQRPVRGHRAALLDRRVEAAGNAHASRHLRHHDDHLFLEPRGAAGRRILLAAPLLDRGVLAHDIDAAAVDEFRAQQRLARQRAARRTNPRAGIAAGGGLLAVLSALRRAAVADARQRQQRDLGIER